MASVLGAVITLNFHEVHLPPQQFLDKKYVKHDYLGQLIPCASINNLKIFVTLKSKPS